MLKKVLLILMMIVVALPSFAIDLSSLRVSAASIDDLQTNQYPAHQFSVHEGVTYWKSSNGIMLPAGEVMYVPGGIMRHDYLNESPMHNYEAGQPQGSISSRFDEIESMVMDPDTRGDRNGWSGWVKYCGPDGTWSSIEERYNTTDSDPDKSYVMTDDEWEHYLESRPEYKIDNDVNHIKSIRETQAALEYIRLHNVAGNPNPSSNVNLDEYNQSIYYDSSANSYYEVDPQPINCEEDDQLAYYNDLDFFVFIEFLLPDTPPTTITGCTDPAYAAANPTLCPPTTCPPGDPTCAPPPTIGGCPQTDPTCHPETETGCPNAPAPGENCTPDSSRDGDRTVFETKPRTYAELKDGSVYNEKWDAMAGVPTTQNLYYGIGGNEYMVKVELELVREETAERDYEFEYKEVINNACLHGDVCDDATDGWEKTSCGSPPSPPTLNTWTDLDGKVYTQTWKTSSIDSCGSDEDPKTKYGGKRTGYGEKDGYKGGSNDNALMVGGYTYNWTQELTYDYVRVNKAEVWKLEGGKLAGLATSVDNIRGTSYNSDYNKMSTGNDVVTASVKYGATTDNGKVLFQQFGNNGDADSGRLRYTFEQSDAESAKDEWTAGVPYSDPTKSKITRLPEDDPDREDGEFMCEESSSYDSVECWALSDGRMDNSSNESPSVCRDCISEDLQMFGTGTPDNPKLPGIAAHANKVTVFSDVLVLATADGYQSVIYFEQDDIPTATSLNEFPYKALPDAEVTYKLAQSIGSWDMSDATTNVSYNGEYKNTMDKYSTRKKDWVFGTNGVPNTMDDYEADNQFPDLSDSYSGYELRMYQDNIDIENTFGNGEFKAGNSIPEYDSIFSHGGGYPMPTRPKSNYYDAYSSPTGTAYEGINSILIHNPIGTKYAYVMGTEQEALDRRTLRSSNQGLASYNAKSNDIKINGYKPYGVASDNNSSFVSLEGIFQIYFPNKGDFQQTAQLGQQAEITDKIGPMYTVGMDTTTWTRKKWVVFPIDVYYRNNNTAAQSWHAAGTRVYLPVNEDTFTFYTPLNNKEQMTAHVTFHAEATNSDTRSDTHKDKRQTNERFEKDFMSEGNIRINAGNNEERIREQYLENKFRHQFTTDHGGVNVTSKMHNNRARTNERNVVYAAEHLSTRTDYIDVVGNIGNMAVEDTGDYRWANYFKKRSTPESWLIPGLVHNVNPAQQKSIMGDQVDIYLCGKGTTTTNTLTDTGCTGTGTTPNLNSHGNQSQKAIPADRLALNAANNPNPVLRNQHMRLGYQIYADLETTGDYMNGRVDINYKYFMLNTQTGNVQKVDLYANVDQTYKQIYNANKIYKEIADTKADKVANSNISINWSAEKLRRNYSTLEHTATKATKDLLDPTIPNGWDYIYGNTQKLVLTGRNRTFIGNITKRDRTQNGGNLTATPYYSNKTRSLVDYYKNGQRWHFQVALPSSTVAVKPNQKPTTENINQFKDPKFLIVVGADINAKGSTWELGYEGGYSQYKPSPTLPVLTPTQLPPTGTGSTPPTTSLTGNNPNPDPNPETLIITTYTPDKSAANDLSTTGTH